MIDKFNILYSKLKIDLITNCFSFYEKSIKLMVNNQNIFRNKIRIKIINLKIYFKNKFIMMKFFYLICILKGILMEDELEFTIKVV